MVRIPKRRIHTGIHSSSLIYLLTYYFQATIQLRPPSWLIREWMKPWFSPLIYYNKTLPEAIGVEQRNLQNYTTASSLTRYCIGLLKESPFKGAFHCILGFKKLSAQKGLWISTALSIFKVLFFQVKSLSICVKIWGVLKTADSWAPKTHPNGLYRMEPGHVYFQQTC